MSCIPANESENWILIITIKSPIGKVGLVAENTIDVATRLSAERRRKLPWKNPHKYSLFMCVWFSSLFDPMVGCQRGVRIGLRWREIGMSCRVWIRIRLETKLQAEAKTRYFSNLNCKQWCRQRPFRRGKKMKQGILLSYHRGPNNFFGDSCTNSPYRPPWMYPVQYRTSKDTFRGNIWFSEKKSRRPWSQMDVSMPGNVVTKRRGIFGIQFGKPGEGTLSF